MGSPAAPLLHWEFHDIRQQPGASRKWGQVKCGAQPRGLLCSLGSFAYALGRSKQVGLMDQVSVNAALFLGL